MRALAKERLGRTVCKTAVAEIIPPNEELIWHVAQYTIPAAMSLLPGKMDSPEARAQLLAIGLQESGFIARQQGGTLRTPGEGPAKSFLQFEKNGGVRELLEETATLPILQHGLSVLGYPRQTPADIHEAMEHNDVLTFFLGRLLLYKDPRLMPGRNEAQKGWMIYLDRWRPGKPHPATWPAHFEKAWSIVAA